MIEADGNTYFACGGALLLMNEGNPKDLDARSYQVIFKDAEGRSHELNRVRIVKMTDLPVGAPPCTQSR
jgi:hypothetical protein